MICSHCGFQNEEKNQFCRNCGVGIQPVQPVNPTVQAMQNPGSNTQLNTQQMPNGQMQQPVQPVNPTVQAMQNPGTNNQPLTNDKNKSKDSFLSIIYVVAPIISIICYWFVGLPAYFAILIAVSGLTLSKKIKPINRVLWIIGIVANILLLLLAIAMMIVIMFSKGV